MTTLHLQYYAQLREQAGVGAERVTTEAASLGELYRELAQRHAFSLPADALKVAVNAQFSDWDRPLEDGDTVVFIPPVAGG
ncbi:MoaD/ThiS family protein [Oleiagrimonas soli]|uniref:Molybdopterin biosynthesis protein D chain n=1 Tax=Oleiagrimonas soli TaxID=1543381 RepID=A0A099CSS8_9GAMM|nr:MoaD/ThiS family protein [Oleiagrimonas soli]KGI76756.1 molybdopterin biosynthesis protein D chain [Oleiagrimonas soli]MBB6185006.1 molybdopterin converting factor subunit 1 [Oleiagrimonas soli]